MVGIVVVSHSQCLAEGAVELAKLMAGNARIAAAGGLEDGTPGTSFEKIMAAIVLVPLKRRQIQNVCVKILLSKIQKVGVIAVFIIKVLMIKI